MIKGVHNMFYTSDPVGLREFFRDKVGFKATDIGDGWLIFNVPEADFGCHPSEAGEDSAPSGTAHISFYCDNIEQTVKEMKEKGVIFNGNIEDKGWGFSTTFQVPGNFSVMLYQPKY